MCYAAQCCTYVIRPGFILSLNNIQILYQQLSSKALYACVLCGEDFTRHSSAKRHRRIVHDGTIVRYNEYLGGRASGIYPPPTIPPRLLGTRKLIKLEGQNNYIEQQHQTEDIIAADSTAESIVCENRKHGMYDMNNEIAINDSNTVETDILASSTSQVLQQKRLLSYEQVTCVYEV